jgi:hypothetical protein
MVRSVAVGLEVAESVTLGVEITEMRAASRQKRDLRSLTPRIMVSVFQRPEGQGAAPAEPLKEMPNCTTTAGESGELNAREGVAFRLQIMGVFMLCGLLATLGWGGMTGLIVLTSKVWPTEDIKEYRDASTNTRLPGGSGLKINHESHELILESGTMSRTRMG